MTTTTYKEHEITFPTEKDPHFRATVAGKMARAASLDAMKKRIDNAKGFPAFDAIMQDDKRGDEKGLWVKVRVVGVEKGYGRGPPWLDSLRDTT